MTEYPIHRRLDRTIKNKGIICTTPNPQLYFGGTGRMKEEAQKLMRVAKKADENFDFFRAYSLFVRTALEFDKFEDINQANICWARAATCWEKYNRSALWEFLGNRLGNLTNPNYKFPSPSNPGQSGMYHIISWKEWIKPENHYYGYDLKAERKHQQAWAYMWAGEAAEIEHRFSSAGRFFRKAAISWELSKWGDRLPDQADENWTKDKLNKKYGNKWKNAAKFYFQTVYNFIQDKGRNSDDSHLFISYKPHRVGWGSEKPLFRWNNIPGNDSSKFLNFLNDYLNIKWARLAKISKSEDGKTILIFTERKSIEITLDKSKRKDLLKFSNGRTYNIMVKEENNNVNIYCNEGAYRNADDIDRMIRCWHIYGNKKKDLAKNLEECCRMIYVLQEQLASAGKREEANKLYLKRKELMLEVYKDRIKGLFSWEEMDEKPRNDSVQLLQLITQKFDMKWIRNAKFTKNNGCKTIKIFDSKNPISFTLNKENNKVDLITNNHIKYDFFVNDGKTYAICRMCYYFIHKIYYELISPLTYSYSYQWLSFYFTGSNSNPKRAFWYIAVPTYVIVFPFIYLLGGYIEHRQYLNRSINIFDAILFSLANMVSISISDVSIKQDNFIGSIFQLANSLSAFFILGYLIWIMTRSLED